MPNATLNTKTIEPPVSLVMVVLFSLLFLLSGVASSYLYYRFGSGSGYLPGIFYTSVTLIVLVACRVPLNAKRISLYYLWMNVTYIVIYFITLFSSWFAFLVGLATSGLGAMITFRLTNRFVVKCDFDKSRIFAWGTIAFLITEIIMQGFDKTIVEYFFRFEGSLDTLFGDVFIFWHWIVGTAFVNMLRENSLTESIADSSKFNS